MLGKAVSPQPVRVRGPRKWFLDSYGRWLKVREYHNSTRTATYETGRRGGGGGLLGELRKKGYVGTFKI